MGRRTDGRAGRCRDEWAGRRTAEWVGTGRWAIGWGWRRLAVAVAAAVRMSEAATPSVWRQFLLRPRRSGVAVGARAHAPGVTRRVAEGVHAYGGLTGCAFARFLNAASSFRQFGARVVAYRANSPGGPEACATGSYPLLMHPQLPIK
ncbi:hypothetical protein FHS42_006247 [Streptomyces zagrosensis]|uniref:Uncharacterized protein n=1 Tax=Streptomyces zagrosensis TaxID=1042984 RepID=A0A7W9QF77_9ACTN|nr:hypothetical protein [Streptomyces zagrosensis]